MDIALLGQVAAWGIAQWAILIIVVLAIVAIVIAVTKQLGITIPPFIITILWILLAAIVGIAAVNFVVKML